MSSDKNRTFTLNGRRVASFVTALGTAFSGQMALGQSATSASLPAPETSSTLKTPSQSQKVFEGYLRFEGMQYPTSVPENSKLDQSLLVSAQVRGQVKGEIAEMGVDVAAGKYIDLGGSQFIVHEIYGSWVPSQQHKISAGRKLEFWSQLDQDWQLGLWQPKSLLDSLRPEDQGLTGVFYKYQQEQIEVLAYGSPIFIPTMGPEVQEKNGSLVAESRWYRSPSPTFPLFDKQTKIVYSLDVPDYSKLVTNPGGGLRVKLGGSTDGLWTSINAGYKPINSLLLKYKKALFLPEQDPQTGEVTISPDVGYHTIYGADIGWRFERAMISASYLADRPDAKAPEAPFVMQNPQPMRAYSAHGELNFDAPFFDEPVGLTANYLRIDGGDIMDFDSEGTRQGAIFDQRFNFLHAASLQTDFSTTVFNRRLMSKVKYMREFEQRGTLVNAEVDFYPTKSLVLILGTDILGVDNTRDDNQDSRFLNQFRANDRYYGGMSYVF